MTGLVQSSTWIFVNIFLARLGQDQLAAGALVGWLFATIVVIIFGVLGAINILVSHKHGAQDVAGIRQVARDGILVAILLSLPFIILFWYMAPIFHYLGQPQQVVLEAQSYLHALSYGIIANFLTLACLEVIIGLGHARVIFVFSAIETILNVSGSYVFIFGKFGLPKMGVAGAGLGLTFCFIGKLLLLLIYIVSRADYRHYFSEVFSLKKPKYLLEIIKLGLPIGLMYCVEVGFFFALTLMMGMLSTVAIAANQIAMQYLGFMMNMVFSIAQAITVRMGHLLGAHDVESARRTGNLGMLLPMGMMCLVAIIYWLLPLPLINIAFNVKDPANAVLVNTIISLLAIAAVFQIFESGRIAMFGALRSLKETKYTFAVSIISFWCLALPVGYMLAVKLKMGPSGYWWGMVVGAGISVFLLHRKFQQKIQAALRAQLSPRS